tara:strand:- start:806 stop:1072 length:267 start_codon:yes stop_codon:yes gene_type:complete
MSKIIITVNIALIKFYKFFISPLLGNNCRYLPTCSDYFIEALKTHGFLKGSYYGYKRVFSCHPLKFFGGGSGINQVPKKKIEKVTHGQ